MDNDVKQSLAIDVIKFALQILPPIIGWFFSHSGTSLSGTPSSAPSSSKSIDDIIKQLNDSIKDSFKD